MRYYDVAQICLNGHVVNDSCKRYPEHEKPFCPKCGQPTIKKCKYCDTEIQGSFHYDNGSRIVRKPPVYCHNCGKPYPWTEANLKAIEELVKLDEELKQEEQQEIMEVLPDLIAETPRTKVAVLKFKSVMGKAGKFTFEAVKEIIVGVASEVIIKALYGP